MIQTIVATFINRITTPNPVVQGSKGTHMGTVAENRAEKKKKKAFPTQGGCKGKLSIPSALCILLLKHTCYLMAIVFPATDITSIKI